MKVALVFGMRLFNGRPLREMIDAARVADELGFEYLCLAEHVLMHGSPDLSGFPFGPPQHTPDELMPEPLTTLAAFAGATSGIGLMTGILIAPLRPAELLARTAATLDALSNGRLVLGVSTSWQAEEYAALGVSFTERGRIMEETLRVCRERWGTKPIRVWFGGKFTPRLVRRVVTLGNGWIPFQGYEESLEEIGSKVQQLRRALREAGRDPGQLDVACWLPTFGRSIAQAMDDIPKMAEAGVTVAELLFTPLCDTPADVPRVLEAIARARQNSA